MINYKYNSLVFSGLTTKPPIAYFGSAKFAFVLLKTYTESIKLATISTQTCVSSGVSISQPIGSPGITQGSAHAPCAKSINARESTALPNLFFIIGNKSNAISLSVLSFIFMCISLLLHESYSSNSSATGMVAKH